MFNIPCRAALETANLFTVPTNSDIKEVKRGEPTEADTFSLADTPSLVITSCPATALFPSSGGRHSHLLEKTSIRMQRNILRSSPSDISDKTRERQINIIQNGCWKCRNTSISSCSENLLESLDNSEKKSHGQHRCGNDVITSGKRRQAGH